MQLLDKVGIITGASRGIGKTIALSFLKEGVKVVATEHNQSLDNLSEEAKCLGGEILRVKSDISSFKSCQEVVEKTLEKFNKIDILVNNAGITSDALLLRMKEEEWDNVIETNLKGVFNFTKAVLRVMIKQHSGKIINISSIVGISGNPGQANYAASKAGIIGFSKSVAKEVASRSICVNMICPGFIETELTEKLSEESKNNILKTIPLSRFGTPEEVADLAVFLASDKSSYITGQVFIIDGGITI